MSVDLLKASEAAQLLRRHPSTLERWRAKGYGPAPIAIGGHWFYQRREIDAFIDQEQRKYREAAEHLAVTAS